MPQGKPLNQRTIDAILASIDAGKSRNETSREHEVSASTVSRIAAANGRSFDRTKTKNATEAAKADNAALRATTSRRFLDECNKFLDDLHKPHTVFNFGGKDNTYNEKTFPEPPTGDKRNLITSAAVAIDKHLAVEKHDNSGEAHAAVDQWLQEMTGL